MLANKAMSQTIRDLSDRNRLTCPDGMMYRVYYAGARDDTTPGGLALCGNIDRVDITQLGYVQIAVGQTACVVGPTAYYNAMADNTYFAPREVYLRGGDWLEMLLDTFAPGDGTEFVWLFEVWEVDKYGRIKL